MRMRCASRGNPDEMRKMVCGSGADEGQCSVVCRDRFGGRVHLAQKQHSGSKRPVVGLWRQVERDSFDAPFGGCGFVGEQTGGCIQHNCVVEGVWLGGLGAIDKPFQTAEGAVLSRKLAREGANFDAGQSLRAGQSSRPVCP